MYNKWFWQVGENCKHDYDNMKKKYNKSDLKDNNTTGVIDIRDYWNWVKSKILVFNAIIYLDEQIAVPGLRIMS